MNININKEVLQKAGEVSLRIGKRIVIEGTKAVILKGTVATLEAKFEGEKVTLDKVLGDGKEAKEKKSLFKRKKKLKVSEEELHEALTDVAVDSFEAGKVAAQVEELITTEDSKGGKSEEA